MPAIPYQRLRQPYPERISYASGRGEFFIVAFVPQFAVFWWRDRAGSGTLGTPTDSGEVARDR